MRGRSNYAFSAGVTIGDKRAHSQWAAVLMGALSRREAGPGVTKRGGAFPIVPPPRPASGNLMSPAWERLVGGRGRRY